MAHSLSPTAGGKGEKEGKGNKKKGAHPGGIIGTDFVVNRYITITHLGVLDDGLGLSGPVSAAIFDTSRGVVLVNRTFSQGVQGQLIGAFRFIELFPPLFLPEGFRATIIAERHDAVAVSQESVTENDGTILHVIILMQDRFKHTKYDHDCAYKFPLKYSPCFFYIVLRMKSPSNLIFKTKSDGITFDRYFILKMMQKKK